MPFKNELQLNKNNMKIIYIFSTAIGLATIPICAKASPYPTDGQMNIQTIARQAFNVANPYFIKKYQEAEFQARARLGKNGIRGGKTRVKLLYVYIEDVVEALDPIARKLSRKEAIQFWTEIEPMIAGGVRSLSGTVKLDQTIEQHIFSLIEYRKMMA